jgi:flagellar biosynthesis/type III secretory pathway protein FliH
MDILHLIDRLEEVVGDARKLPVGGGVVISRQRLTDLIDRMRVAVPKEVYDARDLLEQQEEVLRVAHEDAEMLLSEAKAQIEERLKDDALIKEAEDRAQAIVSEADTRAEELMRGAETQSRERLDEAQKTSSDQMQEADAYALQTLHALEQELDRFLNTVQRGIETLEQRSADRPGARLESGD